MYLIYLFPDISLSADRIDFPPSGELQTVCVVLTAIDDSLLEEEETLCLSLAQRDPFVVIDSGSATTCVRINDTSCK